MKKYTLFILSTLLSFSCDIQTEPFEYKQLHNSELPVFQEFCNKAFKGYITSDEDKDLLNGWTIEKYLLAIADRTNQLLYINACFDKSVCIGFQVLQINSNPQETPKSLYLYDTESNKSIYPYAFIETTFIKKEYRRQGIATKLLEMSEQICKDHNYEVIARIGKSYNQAANNMYHKFNYEQVNPQKISLWRKHALTNEPIDKISNSKSVLFLKHISKNSNP